MIILRSGRSPGHGFAASTEPARGRRYPPNAVRFRSNQVHQSGDEGPVTRAERKSPVAAAANRQQAAMDRVRGGPARALMLIIGAGLALEVILPWAVIWLSDVFLFDIPAASFWLVVGVPPVLSILALGSYRALGAGSMQLRHASSAARQRR